MANSIKKGSKITMEFELRLKDGSVAESTRKVGKPMTFVVGDGRFSDVMVDNLIGLKVGDKKKIMLLAKDAFGDKHPANIYQFPIHRFKDIELEQGLIIDFAQMDGQNLPGIVRKIGESEVTVDFNHPLAGEVVLFDVEILEVQD